MNSNGQCRYYLPNVGIILILFVASCSLQKASGDKTFQNQLMGTWEKTNSYDYILYNALTFRKDGTLIIDNRADTVMYYSYKLNSPFIYLADYHYPQDTITWKVMSLTDSTLYFDKVGINDGLWTYTRKE